MAGINETARLLAELELRDKFSGPARNIGTAVDNLDRRVGGLQSTFGRVGAGLGQMGRGVGQIGHGLDQAATRAVIATVGIGTALITTAASFETAEAGIRKTVGGTVTEVDALVEGVKDMSRTVPVSFEELAAITAEGGALGIANENLLAFTDVVARLGVSTDLSTDQAASAIGQLANVLHLDDTGIRDFADSLVALGNDGASTESQIIDLATRFGAAGHQAGLSNEAILALASTTASMGIEAEAGGGALSRVFNNITLDIATATEEGQILADTMGVSLAELRTAWDQDAGAVFGDLLGVLNQLDNFQQAELLSNLGITNVRDINAITLLSSGVEEYNRQLGVSVGQTDELNRESDVFFNTTEGKWQIFQNNVRLAADAIGGKLLPVVNEVLGDLVAKLSDPAVQRGIEEFGTNLATGVRDFIDEIKRVDFGPLIGTLQGAASIAKGAFDAFRSLPQPIQQLALAAIVANKVTGGAVGSIASGLGNLLGGAFKIAFLDRGTIGNPMWVRQVGLPGAGGGGGGGGPLGLIGPLGIAAAALAAVAVIDEEVFRNVNPLVHDFNALVAGTEGRPSSRTGLEAELNMLSEDLGRPVDDLRAEMIPLLQAGNLTWDEILTEIRNPTLQGVNGPPLPASMGGPGKAPQGLRKVGPFLPDTAMLLTRDENIVATLPDTAMAPVTSELVKTKNATISELLRIKGEVAAQGSRQLAKQDAVAAAVRAGTSVLSSKNFAPKITANLTASVTTNVSISEIQRKITSQSVALGVTPTTPELL